MIYVVSSVFAFMITFPVLLTIVLYFIFLKIYKHARKAVHLAMDGTTIFYMFSVVLLFNFFFNQYYIGVIIAFSIAILIIIVIVQWKKNVEVNIKNAVKLLWRINFIVFLILYLILVLFGIGSRMV